jgi:hypothetical protein
MRKSISETTLQRLAEGWQPAGYTTYIPRECLPFRRLALLVILAGRVAQVGASARVREGLLQGYHKRVRHAIACRPICNLRYMHSDGSADDSTRRGRMKHVPCRPAAYAHTCRGAQRW